MIEAIENCLSDLRSWTLERAEIEKEREKLDDRLEGIDDDIQSTEINLQNLIRDYMNSEEDD